MTNLWNRSGCKGLIIAPVRSPLKVILTYIYLFFRGIDQKVLLSVTVFTGLLIWLNYGLGLDRWISGREFTARVGLQYLVYATAFFVPYFLYRLTGKKDYWKSRGFLFLLFLAPLLFSLKHHVYIPFHPGWTGWEEYWRHVIYWPLLAALTIIVLFLLWKWQRHPADNFYGLTLRHLDLKPYLLMLLMMLPLVAAASTQPDFLAAYPKIKLVSGDHESLSFFQKLLFELSYGTDFISIELFFRGFLVLAFVRWVGSDAILPMACFYCTIHFGKPVGECISSYFGGMLLGVVVYHTRSIVGGLLVHLGIAWLMEAGGHLGNYWN